MLCTLCPQPDGKNISVTIWNLEEYVGRVVHVMLKTSIAPQMAAFRDGFNSVFPIRQMQLFNILELDEMFCGSGPCACPMLHPEAGTGRQWG